MYILIASDVTIHQKNKWIVNHYNCNVRPGEFQTIVGPSHSGKSSLLLALAGFIEPDTGSIFIETHNKRGISKETKLAAPPNVSSVKVSQELVSLGPIPTYAPLFETLTVREQLYYQAKILKQRKPKQHAEELLQMYGLNDVANERCKDLDRFSYFLASLAFTRIKKTPFILLDEPDNGLSDEEWSKAAQYLSNIANEGVGIIFSTTMQTSRDSAQTALKVSRKEVQEIVYS